MPPQTLQLQHIRLTLIWRRMDKLLKICLASLPGNTLWGYSLGFLGWVAMTELVEHNERLG